MRLVVISGRQRGKVFDLVPGRYLVGRGEDADIQVADIAVSRRHCMLEVTADGVTVRDLSSANGTYVNGREVKKARLADGGILRVGESELTLSMAPAEATAITTRAGTETSMTEFMSALIFCSRCNESIPLADIEEGRAAEIDGEYLCARCIREQAADGKNAASG